MDRYLRDNEKVTFEMKKLLSLKLVLPENDVAALERDMIMMINAKLSCPELVMGVEENGLVVLDVLGGALLLSEVGKAVSKEHGKELILLLAQLHEKDIIHGDPLLQNAVSMSDTNNKLMWIDFHDGEVPMPSAWTRQFKNQSLPPSVLRKTKDMYMLLQSLGVTNKVVLSDLIEDYTGTVKQARSIVAQLRD
jgi:tRNA A-37 threonylcarbamoyl transferase component Bud32